MTPQQLQPILTTDMLSLKAYMDFPDALIQVYREEFNIKEMFPWQVECLTHREVAVVREK